MPPFIKKGFKALSGMISIVAPATPIGMAIAVGASVVSTIVDGKGAMEKVENEAQETKVLMQRLRQHAEAERSATAATVREKIGEVKDDINRTKRFANEARMEIQDGINDTKQLAAESAEEVKQEFNRTVSSVQNAVSQVNREIAQSELSFTATQSLVIAGVENTQNCAFDEANCVFEMKKSLVNSWIQRVSDYVFTWFRYFFLIYFIGSLQQWFVCVPFLTTALQRPILITFVTLYLKNKSEAAFQWCALIFSLLSATIIAYSLVLLIKAMWVYWIYTAIISKIITILFICVSEPEECFGLLRSKLMQIQHRIHSTLVNTLAGIMKNLLCS